MRVIFENAAGRTSAVVPDVQKKNKSYCDNESIVIKKTATSKESIKSQIIKSAKSRAIMEQQNTSNNKKKRKKDSINLENYKYEECVIVNPSEDIPRRSKRLMTTSSSSSHDIKGK